MLKDIRLQSETISMEAMGPSQLLRAVTTRLPDFFRTVSQFTRDLINPVTAPLNLVDGTKLGNLLRRSNYLDVRMLEVHTPPGLHVSYLDYLMALSTCADVSKFLITDMLSPFNGWLAQQLATPSSLASLRNGLLIDGLKFHDTESAAKNLAKCFNHGSKSVMYSYGRAVSSNAEWQEVIKRLNEQVEDQAGVSVNEITKLVEQITGNLDRLLMRIEEAPELYKMSGVTLDTISKLCFNMGKEVEFYSIYCYNLSAFQQCVLDSNDKLLAALKID